jgi:hypothetical protein
LFPIGHGSLLPFSFSSTHREPDDTS